MYVWFTGSSMGLFVGFLVGMSTSPVVGGVVSGLGTIVVALIGRESTSTNSNQDSKPSNRNGKDTMALAGVFGLACLLGVGSGVVVRTHRLLEPSIKARIERLRAAGASVTQAKDIVFNWEAERELGAGASTLAGLGVLFAKADQLGQYDPHDIGDEPTAIFKKWHESDIELLATVADGLEHSDLDKQRVVAVAQAIYDSFYENVAKSRSGPRGR